MIGKRGGSGFTITELAVIIAIVGILSIAVIPVLSDRAFIDARGHGDRLRSALQLAQKLAIAQRRNVCVTFDSGTATVTKAATGGPVQPCTLNVADPTSGASIFVVIAPAGVTVSPSPTGITFDGLGAAGAGGTVDVAAGDQSTRIFIEAVTGYVR